MVEVEQPLGVIVQFGGQTPLRLAAELERAGVPLLGTSVEAIDLAEDRGRFGALLERLGYKAPPYATASSVAEALACAAQVGFPLLVRPSYVLGGRAMEIVYSPEGLADYLRREAGEGGDIYLDRFLENAAEVDVDALCDGNEVWIGGIMQHVEEAGVHSGDSACVLPPHSLGEEMLEQIRAATREIALAIGVVGLINVQYAVHAGELYVIEANPRASRTVPFVSKAIGLPLAKLACRIMLGESIAALELPQERQGLGFGDHVSVKEAVLPFDRFEGSDAAARTRDALDGRGDGHRARLPDSLRQGAGCRRRAAAERRYGVHHGHRLRQGRCLLRREQPARMRLSDRRHARYGRGDLTHGGARPGPQQDRRGLSARARLDRARRRRPGGQHTDRRRCAHRRL